jgi:hypothetical protein
MRDLLPEFLEDVARDDASARAAEAAGGAVEAPRGFLARARSLGKGGSRRCFDATRHEPRDDDLSVRFLAEASAVTAAIEVWRCDLAALRRTHAVAADAASTRALAETRHALDEKTRRASDVAARLVSAIDRLERGGETFAKHASRDAPPLQGQHERLVHTVAAGVRARFRDAARAFGAIKNDALRRREETLTTRHFARLGRVPDPEATRRAAEAEAEDVETSLSSVVVGNGDVRTRGDKKDDDDASTRDPSRPAPLRVEDEKTSKTFFSRTDDEKKMVGPTSSSQTTTSTSTQTHDSTIESEKRALTTAVELERDMHQLHAAFVDMATLADSQGERVDCVEAHVAAATSAARRGADSLRRAREYQKQKNRRVRCFCSVAFCIVLVLVVVIAGRFGGVV